MLESPTLVILLVSCESGEIRVRRIKTDNLIVQVGVLKSNSCHLTCESGEIRVRRIKTANLIVQVGALESIFCQLTSEISERSESER